MKPRVSVIMPIYNSEKYVELTINSILKQTYKDFELLLIDDCPTDGTMEVIKKIKDDRIRIIHNEVNSGISYSRNRGLEEARGEYIALMDHDDLTALDRLEIEVEYLDKNPAIDAVGGKMLTMNELGIPIESSNIYPLNNPNFIQAIEMFYNCIANSSVLFRKKVIDKYNIRYQDGCLGMEDYRFWVDFSVHGKITNLPNIFLYWRYAEGSETKRVKDDLAKARAEKYAEIITHALKINGYKLNKKELELYVKAFAETSPRVLDTPDVFRIYKVLRKIVDQAVKKDKENKQEVMYACRKYFLQIVEKSKIWDSILLNDNAQNVIDEENKLSFEKLIEDCENSWPHIIDEYSLEKIFFDLKKCVLKIKYNQPKDVERCIELAKKKFSETIKQSTIFRLNLAKRKELLEKEFPKISIIVPVYNAQDYLDECVNSLLKQTYQNIEVILVDDESTDNSPKMCDEWGKKDERIKAFHVKNKGAGAARNFGLEKITGEFVLFLDSDDWLRADALEILYDSAQTKQSDVVYFDLFYYDQSKDSYTRTYENEWYIGDAFFMRNKLNRCMMPSMCTSMYRVSKWKEVNARFPECHYEDNGIYPYILLKMPNYSIVPQGLYYYRINSGKSFTQNFANNFKRTRPLEFLMKSLEGSVEFEKNKKEVYRFCYNQLVGALNIVKGHFSREEQKQCAGLFNSFFIEYFPEYPMLIENFMFYGSYNIGRIGNNVISHDIKEERYNFSSLIPLFYSEDKASVPVLENKYREYMMKKEQERTLLENIADEQPKYLVFDFLEERYPILMDSNGGLITGTDFIIENIDQSEYKVFERGTDICEKMWEYSCLKFIEYCRNSSGQVKLVMVRTFLAEEFGNTNSRKKYSNIDEIKKINQRLEHYYEFFAENCPEAIDIMPNKEWLYTDKKFKYGCVPEHLNNMTYRLLANMVIGKIQEC